MTNGYRLQSTVISAGHRCRSRRGASGNRRLSFAIAVVYRRCYRLCARGYGWVSIAVRAVWHEFDRDRGRINRVASEILCADYA